MNSLEVAERLKSMPDGSSIALKIGEANFADNYVAALTGVLKEFMPERRYTCIYVTTTTPSHLCKNLLEMFEVDVSNIYFVDAISHIMMNISTQMERTTYIESPTMLENILLKIEYLLKKLENENKLLILDSINTLAIHNGNRILAEFLHILVNNLKSKGVFTIILGVEERNSDEISNMLSLVCDDTIVVK